MQRFSLLAVLLMVIGFAAPAWADNITLSPGASINDNTAHGGQGGQGGQGGKGGDGGTGVGIGVGIGKGGDGGDAYAKGGDATAVNVTDVDVKNAVKVDTTDVNVVGQGQQQSADNKGNKQDVNIDVPRQAPPAVAPGLNVSSLSCYGTWGVGGSSPFGGVSLGFPTLEKGCDYARTAMVLQNLGEPLAAIIFYAEPELGVHGALVKAGRLPQALAAVPAIPDTDLKLDTPLGEPKAEEPKAEPSNFGERTSSLTIHEALVANLAAQSAGAGM